MSPLSSNHPLGGQNIGIILKVREASRDTLSFIGSRRPFREFFAFRSSVQKVSEFPVVRRTTPEHVVHDQKKDLPLILGAQPPLSDWLYCYPNADAKVAKYVLIGGKTVRNATDQARDSDKIGLNMRENRIGYFLCFHFLKNMELHSSHVYRGPLPAPRRRARARASGHRLHAMQAIRQYRPMLINVRVLHGSGGD
jgi:hypothetical protein